MAIFSCRSTGPPRRSSGPSWRPRLSSPSWIRAHVTRCAKPAATNARRARATAPASSVRNEPTRTSKPVGSQIRGVARKAPRSTAAITRPRAETSQDAAPLRSTATGGLRRGSERTDWATRLTSPRREPLLQRRQLQRAQELDLVLELDAELVPGPSTGLRHQGDGVARARTVDVLDEVGVPRRDLGA